MLHYRYGEKNSIIKLIGQQCIHKDPHQTPSQAFWWQDVQRCSRIHGIFQHFWKKRCSFHINILKKNFEKEKKVTAANCTFRNQYLDMKISKPKFSIKNSYLLLLSTLTLGFFLLFPFIYSSSSPTGE